MPVVEGTQEVEKSGVLVEGKKVMDIWEAGIMLLVSDMEEVDIGMEDAVVVWDCMSIAIA